MNALDYKWFRGMINVQLKKCERKCVERKIMPKWKFRVTGCTFRAGFSMLSLIYDNWVISAGFLIAEHRAKWYGRTDSRRVPRFIAVIFLKFSSFVSACSAAFHGSRARKCGIYDETVKFRGPLRSVFMLRRFWNTIRRSMRALVGSK